MDSLPACALTCLVQAAKNSTCSLSDFNCICTDVQLNARLQPCVLQGCTPKEQLTTLKFSYTTCQYPTTDDTRAFPVVNTVGIVIAIISVLLRMAGRLINSTVGIDDYTIMVALFNAIAIAAVGFSLGANGLGKNMWMVPFEKIDKILQLFFVEEVLYVTCIAIIKCSLLLLYLRLFPKVWLRRAILFTFAFTACWGITSLFVQVFSCNPINFYWRGWDGEHKGKCLSHNALLLEHAIINIVLDFLIIVLPMPTLIKLNLSREKRVAMCLMFAVGIIVTIISIFRLVEAVGFNSTTNPTKDFVPVGVWSLLEVDFGIMCSCMPGIRSFLKFLWCTFCTKRSEYASRSKTSTASVSHDRSGTSQNQYQQQQQQPQPQLQPQQRDFIRLEEVEPRHERHPSSSRAKQQKLEPRHERYPSNSSVTQQQQQQPRNVKLEPRHERYPSNSSMNNRGGERFIRVDTELQTSRTRHGTVPRRDYPRHEVEVSHSHLTVPKPNPSPRSLGSAKFTWFREED